jgi:hypothetical protein
MDLPKHNTDAVTSMNKLFSGMHLNSVALKEWFLKLQDLKQKQNTQRKTQKRIIMIHVNS